MATPCASPVRQGTIFAPKHYRTDPRSSPHTVIPGWNPRTMTIHFEISMLQPLIALIAGILILIAPRLLNYVVALYLILLGISGLWPHLLR
jgi:hypothetical protein